MYLIATLDPREPFALRELGDAVSDPGSPAYGQHLDRTALAEAIALPAEERRAIIDWFATAGLLAEPDDGTLGGQRIRFRASAEALETALGRTAALELLRKRTLPSPLCRQVLPRSLAGFMRSIEISETDTTVTSAPFAGSPGSTAKDFPTSGISPRDVMRGYGFDRDASGRGETIALLALGGVPRREDLEGFFLAHDLPLPAVELVAVGPMGARARDPLARFETTMAIQWAGALAPGARIVVYLVDPGLVADPWSAFLLAVLSDTERAPTIAVTTWSCPERQYHRTHGGEVFRGLLDQAAVLGVTVIAASGDWGASGGMPSARLAGERVCETPWPTVSFPACEERVLAVGGTHVRSLDPWHETAWSAPVSRALGEAIGLGALAGGGGFSEHVPIPDWQAPSLAASHARSEGAAVIPHGRGIPDVSLMAWGPDGKSGPAGYQCLLDGQWRDDAGGTSTAAPIWAAIVARMNERRRCAGRGRIGFLQPLLYALHRAEPRGLRSITEGSTDLLLPGYRAGAGWDPATGLGAPDVAALAHALCSPAGVCDTPLHE